MSVNDNDNNRIIIIISVWTIITAITIGLCWPLTPVLTTIGFVLCVASSVSLFLNIIVIKKYYDIRDVVISALAFFTGPVMLLTIITYLFISRLRERRKE